MFIMKMFERDQKGLGIACIILVFCTGIGSLIAFVVGWMHATDWGLKKVMLAWTGLMVAAFVFYALGIALSPGLLNPNVRPTSRTFSSGHFSSGV
jgi:hypothetical protein